MVRRPGRRHGSRFLGVVFCAGLAACQSTANIADSPEDYAHSYVEYPYNSDGHGNDLPLVVGTFSVPSQHRSTPAMVERMQVGYVRYLADTGDANSAVVILSDDRSESTTRRDTYASLRSAMDVVVFHRRGFGLSAPSIDCGLFQYPLRQPLLISGLRDAAIQYSDRCLEQWEAAKLPRASLTDAEVAHDLYDLSRVIGKDRFYLVLERSMTGIGIETARRHPGLIAGIILMNPELSAGELSAVYWENVDVAGQFTLLEQELLTEPVIVQAATRSGTPATVAIGPLDLAFVISSYRRSGDDMKELLGAARNAMNGDYSALGTIVLEMRKNLGSPGNAMLIASANRLYRQHADDGDVRQFAVDWPASAFPDRATAGGLSYGQFEAPILVLKGRDGMCNQPALADPGYGKAAVVYVANSWDKLLDQSAGLSTVIREFIAGKRSSRTCI